MAKPVLIIWLSDQVNPELQEKLRKMYDEKMPKYEVIFMTGAATMTYFPSNDSPPIHLDPRPIR